MLRRGSVVNLDKAVRAIADAVAAAEQMSGRTVKECTISIGGPSIECRRSRGVVAVTGRNHDRQHEVSQIDIDRVLQQAAVFNFPLDREIVDVIPLNFKVDSSKDIRVPPLSMLGVKLEAEVNIVTCSMTLAHNIVRCVNNAGFHVNGYFPKAFAAAVAVLTEEEKDLGVMLIDIGGGTSDVVIYKNGSAFTLFSIPYGGDIVTNDISYVVSEFFKKTLSVKEAEIVKTTRGCCGESFLTGEDIIVPGTAGHEPLSLPESGICQIIEARMHEIFTDIQEALNRAGGDIPQLSRIVLTGGGAALPGCDELAKYVFNLPVRVGRPNVSGGVVDDYRASEFATAVGLVLETDARAQQQALKPRPSSAGESRPELNNNRFISWIKDTFF
jgi:cell division protein FtsA